MHRIDHPTADANANGSGKAGFTNGNPGQTPRTIVDDAWFNAVQENIAQAIEAAGITLVKGAHSQLAKVAVPLLCSARFSGSGVADGANFTISALDTPSDSGFVLAANAITVPSFGYYLVILDALIAASSATNPLTFGVQADQGGLELRKFLGTRFSATTADKISVGGAMLWPAASTFDVLTLKPFGATNGTIAAGEGRLSILRLRDTT